MLLRKEKPKKQLGSAWLARISEMNNPVAYGGRAQK